MVLLEEIAAYFREVRKKYVRFEGALKGIDSRILRAQVPGGMLTNMENQLKEQGASDKMDAVLEEIPRVREDLGFLPLVTPTSQIVGSQSVINVLMGERYKSMTKETEGVLKGEYGATPAPVNAELQARVLKGEAPITCRPADLIAPELDKLRTELADKAKEQGFTLASESDDDVMTYALFNQIGLQFLKNRGNPGAFEPVPSADDLQVKADKGPQTYTVNVEGQSFVVEVSEGGDINTIAPVATAPSAPAQVAPAAVGDIKCSMSAPLSGNIFKVLVSNGQAVKTGEVLIILEAMKMETEIRAPQDGVIANLAVKQGDSVTVGSALLALA
jgi:oxaloacetate decarboxylase alpha subunit